MIQAKNERFLRRLRPWHTWYTEPGIVYSQKPLSSDVTFNLSISDHTELTKKLSTPIMGTFSRWVSPSWMKHLLAETNPSSSSSSHLHTNQDSISSLKSEVSRRMAHTQAQVQIRLISQTNQRGQSSRHISKNSKYQNHCTSECGSLFCDVDLETSGLDYLQVGMTWQWRHHGSLRSKSKSHGRFKAGQWCGWEECQEAKAQRYCCAS